MPEFSKLIAIASELGVSPGWLAFGDSLDASETTHNKATISKESMGYLFKKVARIPISASSLEDSSAFLVELVHAISLINGAEGQNKKIIDLALTSGTYFSTNI